MQVWQDPCLAVKVMLIVAAKRDPHHSVAAVQYLTFNGRWECGFHEQRCSKRSTASSLSSHLKSCLVAFAPRKGDENVTRKNLAVLAAILHYASLSADLLPSFHHMYDTSIAFSSSCRLEKAKQLMALSGQFHTRIVDKARQYVTSLVTASTGSRKVDCIRRSFPLRFAFAIVTILSKAGQKEKTSRMPRLTVSLQI